MDQGIQKHGGEVDGGEELRVAGSGWKGTGAGLCWDREEGTIVILRL